MKQNMKTITTALILAASVAFSGAATAQEIGGLPYSRVLELDSSMTANTFWLLDTNKDGLLSLEEREAA